MKIIFEENPENLIFGTNEGQKTWAQVKEEMRRTLERITPAIEQAGYKKAEVGSFQHFFSNRKRTGKFITLSTMFLARLTKR